MTPSVRACFAAEAMAHSITHASQHMLKIALDDESLLLCPTFVALRIFFGIHSPVCSCRNPCNELARRRGSFAGTRNRKNWLTVPVLHIVCGCAPTNDNRMHEHWAWVRRRRRDVGTSGESSGELMWSEEIRHSNISQNVYLYGFLSKWYACIWNAKMFRSLPGYDGLGRCARCQRIFACAKTSQIEKLFQHCFSQLSIMPM